MAVVNLQASPQANGVAVYGGDIRLDFATDQYVVIPLASLSELTTSEITGPFSDIRAVYFAIVEALYQGYVALPPSDRPRRMSISRSTGDFGGLIVRTYRFEFITDTAGEEAALD